MLLDDVGFDMPSLMLRPLKGIAAVRQALASRGYQTRYPDYQLMCTRCRVRCDPEGGDAERVN